MFRSLLLSAVWVLLFAPGAVALTIDDFNDAGAAATTPITDDVDAQIDGAGILGGERDVNVTRTAGIATGQTSATFGAGNFDYLESNADRDGTFTIDYDGNDDSAALAATGLLSVDFTMGGAHDALLVPVASSNEALSMTITVRTDAANFSTFDVAIPVTAGLGIKVLFTSFVIGGGSGADFADVGSLSLSIANNITATDFSLGGAFGAFQTVPEPGAGLLLGLGLLGLAGSRRRGR